jgi:O-antigen/teichoic acid export membrane protein
MMISGITNFSIERIDIIMLGIFSTTQTVGVYSVAAKLASATSFCLIGVNAIIAPKLSELHWSDNHTDLKQVVRFAAKLMFMTAFPVLLALLFWSEFFLGLFGDEFKIGKQVMILLCVGQFVNAACGSVGYFLNTTGRQRIFRNIVLCAALINIVLNCILIPRYGMVGAAIASMTSIMFWNIVSAVYIKIMYNVQTFYLPWVYS